MGGRNCGWPGKSLYNDFHPHRVTSLRTPHVSTLPPQPSPPPAPARCSPMPRRCWRWLCTTTTSGLSMRWRRGARRPRRRRRPSRRRRVRAGTRGRRGVVTGARALRSRRDPLAAQPAGVRRSRMVTGPPSTGRRVPCRAAGNRRTRRAPSRRPQGPPPTRTCSSRRCRTCRTSWSRPTASTSCAAPTWCAARGPQRAGRGC